MVQRISTGGNNPDEPAQWGPDIDMQQTIRELKSRLERLEAESPIPCYTSEYVRSLEALLDQIALLRAQNEHVPHLARPRDGGV